MRCMRFSFRILSFCGIWQPLHWQDRKHLRYFYKIYSFIAVSSIYMIALLQAALFLFNELSISFIADILFTLLCAVSIVTKALNFLFRRDQVVDLANMLMKSWCLPINAAEIRMDKKSDEFLKVFTLYFNALAQLGLVLMIAMPLILQEPGKRELQYPMWLPYDIQQSDLNFWLTFVILSWIMVIAILLNVTVDVVVSGFVLKGCMQLDMLKNRLNQLPGIVKRIRERGAASKEAVKSFEQRTLRQAIMHHNYIIKFATVVTETFDLMIVEQFFAGALVFSVIVYVLTNSEVPLIKKLMTFIYLSCMTGEIFAYCYFGNEITIKSSQLSTDIYNIDWTALSLETQKMLIVIMMRTNKPIIMSYANLIILNLDSFKSILKVSYTALNVIKESS